MRQATLGGALLALALALALAACASSSSCDNGEGEGCITDPVAQTGTYHDCTDSFDGIVGTGTSYYRITDLGAAGQVRIYALNNLTDDVDGYVYSDALFSVLVASDVQTGTSTEYPIWTPSSDVYYLKVDGSNTVVGATYRWSCSD